MPELRWILLVLGALLVAGLWWWELQRSRPKDAPPPPVEPEPSRSAPAERQEPRFGDGADDAEEEIDLPSIRAEERPIPHGDPPVVTIDDLPEDVDHVVLAPQPPEPRRMEPITARRDVPGSFVPEVVTVGSTESPSVRAEPPPARVETPRVEAPARAAPPREPAPRQPVSREPTKQQEPVLREPAARAPDEAVEARRPAARPMPGRTASPAERLDEPRPAPAEPPSQLQKIVALRLVAAHGERIDGGRLRAALEAEGMRFGKYSIFHRQRADGRALYSVASLLEPGSFDLDRMDQEQYPGISMFAVFPGPIGAPEAFDELLATARRLAERLTAIPQDERGNPLGAQRALAIREELVHFQGLVDKTRQRQSG